MLFSQWLLSQSYFTPREEGAQKPSCRGLAGPVTNFMCRQFIRQLFGVRLFYHRSHFDLCLGRLKSGNVGGNSCHVPTVAWGLRTLRNIGFRFFVPLLSLPYMEILGLSLANLDEGE